MKVGDRVEQIRIVERLGSGGMGEVFVGFDETLERRVALKTIRGVGRLDPGARARFLREARILSQLDHPSICRIYDYVSSGDDELLVLELIDGETLREAVESDPPGRQRSLEIALQIASVLAAAHGAGIVHRDLKPGNVMITRTGEVKVLDFGLARAAARGPAAEAGDASPGPGGPTSAEAEALLLEDATEVRPPGGVVPELTAPGAEATATAQSPPPAADVTAQLGALDISGVLTVQGSVLGTPVYMSPEQARGEEVTTASDMYSFGLLLQWLAGGAPPHPEGLAAHEILLRAARGESAPAEGLDSDTAALVERLKSRAPAARPTALEAVRQLRWLLDRPRRRLRRIVAAAAVLLVVLGVTKYLVDLRRERQVAVAAQELAERRRGQAEELIGFMLGDLRSKLEPLGRLEILDDVGGEAMEYFAAVNEEELSDHELSSRSRALYQIGEVRIAQGDLAGAAEPLGESLELARALAARHPGDGERLFELGQAHFWVGFVHWRRGELAAAEEQFEEYLEVSRRLVEMEPGSLPWKLELAYAHSNLGSIRQARGDLGAALDRFEAALTLKRALCEASPDNASWRFDLARTHNTVGYIEEALGRFGAAFEHYGAELAIKEELSRQRPDHLPWRYELAINRNILGELHLAAGAPDEALGLHRAALEVLAALVAEDPTNTTWAWELGVTRRLLGSALVSGGQAQAGLAELEGSVTALAPLAAAEPTEVGLGRDLAASRVALAEGLLAVGRPTAAERAAGPARDSLAELVAGRSDERRAQVWLSRAHAALAEAAGRDERPEQADRQWRLAAESVEELAAGSSDHRLLAPWLAALEGLERRAEARAVARRLREMGYRGPATRRADSVGPGEEPRAGFVAAEAVGGAAPGG